MFGEGDPWSEPRVDEQIIFRFVKELKGGKEADVALRKANSRPGVDSSESVGRKGAMATVA